MLKICVVDEIENVGTCEQAQHRKRVSLLEFVTYYCSGYLFGRVREERAKKKVFKSVESHVPHHKNMSTESLSGLLFQPIDSDWVRSVVARSQISRLGLSSAHSWRHPITRGHPAGSQFSQPITCHSHRINRLRMLWLRVCIASVYYMMGSYVRLSYYCMAVSVT